MIFATIGVRFNRSHGTTIRTRRRGCNHHFGEVGKIDRNRAGHSVAYAKKTLQTPHSPTKPDVIHSTWMPARSGFRHFRKVSGAG